MSCEYMVALISQTVIAKYFALVGTAGFATSERASNRQQGAIVMPNAKQKWLAWIAGAVVASATVFLLVTEIYPAIHAWRVKMENDAGTSAAQRDQARAQAGALTDHAPLSSDVDARLRAKGIAPNSP
jgi:hypothetical protein